MHKHYNLTIFLAITLFYMIGVSQAKEYKLTLHALNNKLKLAKPGDIYLIMDGVYENIRINIHAKGTETNPVIVRSEHPNKVVITGKSQCFITGCHVILDGFLFQKVHNVNVLAFLNAQHCRLTNTTFENCGNPISTASHIVRIMRSSKCNKIDHCLMQGNLSMGMGVWCNHHDHDNVENIFEYNHFQDIARLSPNGQEAIQIGQDYYSFFYELKTIVRFCLFERASGDAEIISSKSSGNIFRHNTFKDCFGGLVLRGGNGSVVDGNFFFNTTTGVRVHGNGHTIINNYMEGVEWGINMPAGSSVEKDFGSHQVTTNCLVAHNTIINSKKASLSLGNNFGWKNFNFPPLNNRIVNNIFFKSEWFWVHNKGSDKIFFSKNILWGYNYKLYGLDLHGKSFIIKNPYLKKNGSIFKISSSLSSAINSSYLLDNITEDINGNPRDNTPDVGCEEFSELLPKYKPLTDKDVGPSWKSRCPPLPSPPARTMNIKTVY